MTRQPWKPDWQIVSQATQWAVDNYLSNVDSLLIALSQRSLTDEQQDRLAAILQRSERALLLRKRRKLGRCTRSGASRRATATAK